MRTLSILTLLLFYFSASLFSQQKDPETIKAMVKTFKNDLRGPYKDIRWFCTDGSIRAPKDPCPEAIGPGVQHARYKDAVVALGESNHLYLGQILAYTDKEALWDAENGHSRLIQYQLEKYLKGVDNGWILQKGQYYRGAIQAEDEQAWGRSFYTWLLGQDSLLISRYFLIRQSLKDIPHGEESNTAQQMRIQSKVISDTYPNFMDLRVKIHSEPEPSDIEKVLAFRRKNDAALTPELRRQFEALLKTMREFHKPADLVSISKMGPAVKQPELKAALENLAAWESLSGNPAELTKEVSRLLLLIREKLSEEKDAAARLELLDISLELEKIAFKNAIAWQTPTLATLLEKICHLGMAAAGAGYLEIWEWNELVSELSVFDKGTLSLDALDWVLQRSRSAVEWSASMIKAHYEAEVATYLEFEPLVSGFIDDRIRGSVALHLGHSIGELGNFIAQETSLTNKMMQIPNQSTIRGLNPGFAMGELVVIEGSPEGVEVASDKIYIFRRPPSDLKPVAGIATVAEGNMVSHVQLLARNLAIPNAALSDQNLLDLRKHNGNMVFYAVSNQGNVIMKPVIEMTAEEKALFAKRERRDERVAVPTEQMQLDVNKVLNLRSVDAGDSGQLCGPKAANLGQLKKMFPEKVVEGLVIPFGIFRSHMDQPMPGQQSSYWGFLQTVFAEAERMRSQNIPEAEVENFQLRQLKVLREAILKMPFQDFFADELERGFREILGADLGEIAVFLRSDTNMEDLKDFTGAGLNLTIFNSRDKEKILDGIRAVWASPYTERSFKWRQKFLLNPENVYPSILVIPSVDVEYSGVLITKGLVSGSDTDLTIAFSRGAGGAVDGQAAESYLLRGNGENVLLAPAREVTYTRLPAGGGTRKDRASFEKPVLSKENLREIRKMAAAIQQRIPVETGSDYQGAYDVELGFLKNRLWLFQIRPFVENKKATSSDYLESISPAFDKNRSISLTKKINP
ncbi:PEP/pyruvate-binding domain-containing protein [Robiginitalea sp. IMCC43444]|uniref:PEP/pyruvate-binding domain-containing protein n=1 Tax=Robiginitalea sp. IMCC43444 TaxID=3459121 RepID=UPI0040415684